MIVSLFKKAAGALTRRALKRGATKLAKALISEHTGHIEEELADFLASVGDKAGISRSNLARHLRNIAQDVEGS